MSFQDTYLDTTNLVESREERLGRIDPAKTPLFDMATVDAGVVSNVHSWDEDDVTTSSGTANKNVQGADYSYVSTAPVKRTNYTQLFYAADKVTYTNQNAKHPAVQDKISDKALWLTKKIKLDAEWSMFNGSLASGSTSVASEMGGLKAWAQAATTDAQTGGTVLTVNLFIAFLKKGWDLGAEWDTVFVNGLLKSNRIDQFSTNNYQRNTNKMTSLEIHYDIVETSFGTVTVIPHRDIFVAAGQMVAIQSEFISKGVLQTFQRDQKVAPTGTAMPIAIFGEYTLIPRNVKGVGKASGYTG